jgi:hypothetical protein
LIVPATRQRSTGAFVEPETVLPAVYDWARVIVVSASMKPVRSAQLAAATASLSPGSAIGGASAGGAVA